MELRAFALSDDGKTAYVTMPVRVHADIFPPFNFFSPLNPFFWLVNSACDPLETALPVLPLLPQDAAARVAHMATEMLDYVEKLPPFHGHNINIR